MSEVAGGVECSECRVHQYQLFSRLLCSSFSWSDHPCSGVPFALCPWPTLSCLRLGCGPQLASRVPSMPGGFSSMRSDDGIEVAKLEVSLKCPFSFVRIKVHIRLRGWTRDNDGCCRRPPKDWLVPTRRLSIWTCVFLLSLLSHRSLAVFFDICAAA